MPPLMRRRQPSWSNNSVQRFKENDRFSESTIGYAVSSDSEQISPSKGFGNSFALADLQAQLRATSLSNTSFVPLAVDNQPKVIPATLNWREHPRWKPLLTTPTRPPNSDNPLVPDRSPTPTKSNINETEELNTDSPGSFIHRRRRKEHIHRPPVLYVRNSGESVPDYDPFLDAGFGSHQYPQRQALSAPFPDFRQSLEVRTTLVSAAPAVYPIDWDGASIQSYASLPKIPTLRSLSNEKFQPRSYEDHSIGPCTALGTQGPSPDGHTDLRPPDVKGDREASDRTRVSLLNSSYRDIHTTTGEAIYPGSLVMCVCKNLSHQWDEFDLEFGDVFTVLRIFEDGWALCGSLVDSQPCIQQSKASNEDESFARTDPQAENGKSIGDVSINPLSHKTWFNIALDSVVSNVPLAILPGTKFLPLVSVTSITNFGRIARKGFATFGKLDIQPPPEDYLLMGDMASPTRTASLNFQVKGHEMDPIIQMEVRYAAMLGYPSSPIQANDIPVESSIQQRKKTFHAPSLRKTFNTLTRKLTGGRNQKREKPDSEELGKEEHDAEAEKNPLRSSFKESQARRKFRRKR